MRITVYGYQAYRGIAGGYWLMLQPLGPGNHILTYGAKIPSEDQTFDTIARVVTTPEPSTLALTVVSALGLALLRRRRRKLR